MINVKTGRISSFKGMAIYRRWTPSSNIPVKGVIQIIHGMMEHGGRYEPFAHWMCQNGYVVYALDLQGHGQTAGGIEELGKIPKEGWGRWLEDIQLMTQEIQGEWINQPIILLGHSMGAFLALHAVKQNPKAYHKIILSGASYKSPWILKASQFLATILCAIRGKNKPGYMLHILSFFGFNRGLKPRKTSMDWLSSDATIPKNYIVDPYCGFIVSNKFFQELFRGFRALCQKPFYDVFPKNIPILIISGEKDPLNSAGNPIQKLLALLESSGIQEVSTHIYSKQRHEVLNEVEKERVFQDILQFI